MPIRALDPSTTAAARLNSLRFTCPVSLAAEALANWQAGQGGLLVPISIPLPRASEEQAGLHGPAFFRERAKQVRAQIAKELGLPPEKTAKLVFTMTSKDAWYLGPRPNLDLPSTLAAVAGRPERFIELMLLKELVEAAAIDKEDTFVGAGFGPGVYLGSLSQATKKYLHLAQAEFAVNAKHAYLLCDVTAKTFAKKLKGSSDSSSTRAADAGEGYLVGVTRIVPDHFAQMDARKHPMVGVSLDTVKMRRTRLYYLNLLTEFAMSLFTKAGVPFERETFVASHCVDEAYIPLEPLANLQRPLVVVNATMETLDSEALAPLVRFPEYLPGYHVAGSKKTHFPAPDVRTAAVTSSNLEPGLNYLFLSGEGDEECGSVRLAKKAGVPEFKPARAHTAYAALAKGDSVADPYTESKFHNLLARDTVRVATQGLDFGPKALAALRPGKADDGEGRQLQEALKRCLVELSLKEVLLGRKSVKVPAMPDGVPGELTLLATRRIRMAGKQAPEQLVSAVDVRVDGDSLRVTRVRRTPWGDPTAIIDFVGDFPFLQESGKEWIRDAQFWVVDRTGGERLTVWSGAFVPKIILNDAYVGIEQAISTQDRHLEEQRASGSQGRFLSKAQNFNLLPYYISMYRPEHIVRGERVGVRMPVQDRGAFVRVFVPPEGGISGAGDALSAMRDLVLYDVEGQQAQAGLLERPLVQLYLHSMTNGVLVGGDNSKMSVLEKLARLALEN